MSKPVLIIITSSTCGHCTRYKQNNEKNVMEMLRRENLVTVYQMHDGVIQPPVRVHPHLNKYIEFVPSFVLLTKESWEGNGPLIGSIMNQEIGSETDSGFVKTKQAKTEYFNTSEGIKDWITRELRNNTVFNSNIPQSFNAHQDNSNMPYKIVPLLAGGNKEQRFIYKNDSSSESD